MNPPSTVLLAQKAVLAALASALSFAVFVASPQVAGAVEPQGSMQIKMAFGQAGQAFKQQGVKTVVTSPMVRRVGTGGNLTIDAPVKEVTVDSKAKVSFNGSLIFKRKVNGKSRQVRLSGLMYEGSKNSRFISASSGGKRIQAFGVPGAYSANRLVGTVSLPSQSLNLTKAAANMVKKTLRLKRLPASKLGMVMFDSQAAFEDPYAAECELPATEKIAGTLSGAGPLPELPGAVPLVGQDITWGFKSSFRGYIFGVGGLFEGVDGASVNLPPFPGPPSGFTFPFELGTYSAEGSESRAVLRASGAVTACHKGQFRLTMSDPAVVIDGSESRIVMTIDTNVSGVWIPDQRVDFATIDTTGITPTEVDGVTTWASIPTALTEEGADSLRLCAPGAPPPCLYAAGTALDPITVRANPSLDR